MSMWGFTHNICYRIEKKNTDSFLFILILVGSERLTQNIDQRKEYLFSIVLSASSQEENSGIFLRTAKYYLY